MAAPKVEAEWERLSRVVATVLVTGLLDDEKPVSLLVLGEPGLGKSALIGRFNTLPTVRRISDATSDSFRHVILREMCDSGHSHLLLPEFYKLFQRKSAAVDNMAGILSAAMTGELHQAYQGQDKVKDLPDGFTVGVIGGMTTGVFSTWSKEGHATGFISRFLTMTVTYSPALTEHILQAVAQHDEHMLTPYPWPYPREKQHVHLPRNLGSQIRAIAKDHKSHENNARFVGQTRALVKAVALMARKRVVNAGHVQEGRRLMRYILEGNAK